MKIDIRFKWVFNFRDRKYCRWGLVLLLMEWSFLSTFSFYSFSWLIIYYLYFIWSKSIRLLWMSLKEYNFIITSFYWLSKISLRYSAHLVMILSTEECLAVIFLSAIYCLVKGLTWFGILNPTASQIFAIGYYLIPINFSTKYAQSITSKICEPPPLHFLTYFLFLFLKLFIRSGNLD